MNVQQPTDELAYLQGAVRSKAGWFYTISGISLVNAVCAATGLNYLFFVSLLVPVLCGSAVHDGGMGGIGTALAIVSAVVPIGIFTLIGFFASRGSRTAFMIGIVLYVIDAGLYAFMKEWPSVAFHVYAIYRLSIGFSTAAAMVTARKSHAAAAADQAAQERAAAIQMREVSPATAWPPATSGDPETPSTE